jgi:hypothetical protein
MAHRLGGGCLTSTFNYAKKVRKMINSENIFLYPSWDFTGMTENTKIQNTFRFSKELRGKYTSHHFSYCLLDQENSRELRTSGAKLSEVHCILYFCIFLSVNKGTQNMRTTSCLSKFRLVRSDGSTASNRRSRFSLNMK